jgi:hypothetical protein
MINLYSDLSSFKYDSDEELSIKKNLSKNKRIKIQYSDEFVFNQIPQNNSLKNQIKTESSSDVDNEENI